MVNINQLFAENGFTPEPDAELTTLLGQGLEHMGQDGLITYIHKVKRFDTQPVHVTQSYPGEFLIDMGNSQPVYWFYLRKDLEILPNYFALADSLGLDQEKGANLLFSLVDSYKYDFYGVTDLIKTLTQIMEICAGRNLDFRASVPEFQTFLETAREDGEVGGALGIVQLGIAAGMKLEQSMEIVTDIYERSGLASYVFMALYDELAALRANDVDGNLIFHSLKAVIGDDDLYYKQDNFSAFTQLLYIAATHTGYSQTAILEKITGRRATGEANRVFLPANTNDGEASDVLERVSNELMPVSASGEAELATIVKQPDEYFPDIETPQLVHGILPYRTQRSLWDGLNDLHELMETEIQEGAWVFDPVSETWYSLGGRTHFQAGRVRQEFFPYDVSALSSSPVFLHIHPAQCETFISPSRDSLSYPQLQKKITKFLATMPSSADYRTMSDLMKKNSQSVPLSGLIVTSTGLTEMRVPNDPECVANFSESFTDLKDEALLEFDAAGYLVQHGIEEPNIDFIQRLLAILNRKLPDDFQISIHSYDEPVELNASPQAAQRQFPGYGL